MKLRPSALALAMVVVLFLTSILLAQSGGAVSGQVTDRSSNAIASARVVIRNIATGLESETKTDNAGRYQFNGLGNGSYRITVEHEGFSTAAQAATITSGNEKATADFTLEVGDIAEQVSITATRGERDALEIPVRTETVTREEILRQNVTTTQDTMTNVPNVTAVGNGPFQMRPRLRGLDSTRILVIVDGERLNTARVATDRAGPEIGLVDPTNLQSVEIVSGSGSVLYGTDALSGTINFITAQPQASSDGIRVGGGLNLFYSSNEDGRRGAAEFNVSGRRFAVRFTGGLERFANYHAGEPFGESSLYLHQNGTLRQQILSRVFPDPFNAPFTRTSSEIPNSNSHGNSVNGVGRLFFGDGDGLKLSWTRRRNDNIGFPDFSPPYFSQILSLPFSNLDKYGVRYEKRSSFSSMRLSGYFQVQDRALRNDFEVFSSSPPQPGAQPLDSIVRIKLLTDTRQNVKSYGFDGQWNFTLSSHNLLTFGMSVLRDHSRDSRRSVSEAGIIAFATRPPAPPRLIPLPAPISFGPPSTTFPQRVPKSNFTNFGYFAQDEYEVNRYLRIVGGLRLDFFFINSASTPGYNPLLPGIQNATPAIDLSKLPSANGESFSRKSVSGDIGVVVRPKEYLSLTARVGRSFRHPNLEELFFTGPATVGNIIANTQVKPETGINVDVGAKLRTGRYTSSFTYFNNTYRNYISTEFIAQAPAPTGLIAQALNFAKLRIQGFEADAQSTYAVGGAVVSPFIGVGYLRGQILKATNPFTGGSLNDVPADNISPLKGVVGVRLQSRTGRWWSEYNVRAHAHVERVSPLLTDSPFLIAQDLLALRGFGVQNLRGGYNFERERGRVAVTLGLENFTNEFYREQFQFAPSRGRSFTVGLLFKYF
jgi:outer membrane receptor protein involved in Fe transport